MYGGGTAPPILSVSNRRREVAAARTSIFAPGNNPLSPLNKRFSGPKPGGYTWREKVCKLPNPIKDRQRLAMSCVCRVVPHLLSDGVNWIELAQHSQLINVILFITDFQNRWNNYWVFQRQSASHVHILTTRPRGT